MCKEHGGSSVCQVTVTELSEEGGDEEYHWSVGKVTQIIPFRPESGKEKEGCPL